MKLNILGTTYRLRIADEWPDRLDPDAMGVCDRIDKVIWVNGSAIAKEDRSGRLRHQVMRHEIIHAYLAESGMTGFVSLELSWYECEEMVDWFAVQFPKIKQTFEKAGCL